MTTRLFKHCIPAALLLALALQTGCGEEGSTPPVEGADGVHQGSPVSLSFERVTLDSAANGPAFVTLEDVNADGRLDLIVSKFGQVDMATFTIPNGEVTAYLQGESLMDWTPVQIVTQEDGIIWPNDVTMHDIDLDGDLDAVVPSGFLACAFIPGGAPCGSLQWFENTGGDFVPHVIVDPGNELFFHLGLFEDIDNDGIRDLLTVGEKRPAPGMGEDEALAMWFKGDASADRFEKEPRIIGEGMGSMPTLHDVDGDGDLDIVSAEFFANMDTSFAWYERLTEPSVENPGGQWKRHVIDDQVGPAIQLSLIADFIGDGQLMAVGANHVNTAKSPADPWESAIYMYASPAYPREPWQGTKISEGIGSEPGLPTAPQAAPGIFGHGDAEGDGDIDLIVSGDGDPTIYLLEQTAPGAFTSWIFDEGLPQAGGMKISDLDGDGVAEIVVTGYENNVLNLYIQADNGPHPIAPVVPVDGPLDPEATEGDVAFRVFYDGDVQGNLLVALFAGDSPAGPPVAIEEVTSATFPADVTLSGVEPGQHVAVVTLDAAPFNPMVAGPEDVTTMVPVAIPSTEGTIEVSLGGAVTQPPVTSGDAPGDVTVTVNYAGPETGDVVLAAFTSLPPMGPPAKYLLVSGIETFPATAVMEGVPAGTYQLMAYLDLAPLDPAMAGDEDPMAESAPFTVGSEPVTLDITLIGDFEVEPPVAQGACTNAEDSALITGLG